MNNQTEIPGGVQMTGAELIAHERERQMLPASSGGEGNTKEHDDAHTGGEMAIAAACYILRGMHKKMVPSMWPWEAAWWKPSDPIRNLVKAGALIAAEIDRLQRLQCCGHKSDCAVHNEPATSVGPCDCGKGTQ